MAAVDIDAIKKRATAAYKAFTPAQLVLAALLLVVAIVGGMFFMSWVTAPSYAVLSSGLSATDAASMTSKLSSDGVPYKLSAGGGTISIPSNKLDAERIALAAAGLPKGNTGGWDILDKEGLTVSSFRQQVDYQRALEGEIASTLQSMDGISQAQVHLVLPDDQLFSDQQSAARASVMLTTTDTLTSNQVKAVVSLVSSAVKNLDPSNVTVTDASGRLLSAQGGGSSDQMAQQGQYEDGLNAQAQTLLDQVLGAGKSVVRINAALDFSQTTTDRKVVDPTKSAATSSTKSTETYNGGAANAASGQVSVTNSTTGSTSSTNGNSTYSKTTQASTQDNSEQVDHINTPPGAVKRLTVAVAVDAGVKAPPAAQLQSLIGNAVGFDSTRGDSLSVTTTPFAASSANTSGKSGKSASSGAASGTMISTVVAGVMLLVITFLLARSVRRPKVEAVDLPEEYAGALTAGSGRHALSAGGAGSAIPLTGGPRALTSGSSESLIGAVDERSDEVAQLLRGWLADNTSAGASSGGTR
jgi:flagellar M-ring protein FliF